MIPYRSILRCAVLIALPTLVFAGPDTRTATEFVNGTTGTPLGGFGAGAVKFNANDGTFSAMLRPPADAYDFERVRGAAFLLYTQRSADVTVANPLKAKVMGGRPDDDAIWPIHRVNFGESAGVRAQLTAFGPLDRSAPEKMSLPYAFYEVSLTNSTESETVAACALRWPFDEKTVKPVPGKGLTSRSWAVVASSEANDAELSTGGEESFLKSGTCVTKAGENPDCVAVRVKLAANQTAKIRFVLAWYDDSDPERCYYLGLYDSPAPIAEVGLERFDELKSNAETLVARMRASNLPSWLQNQTLNTLANLSTNSMYKKDGRVAFAEGEWTCFGTMDQMWHARQIVGQLIPFFAWEELRYWARTQRKDGQIHHDFNHFSGGEDKATRSVLVKWDDTEHQDYRNIDKWVDLNCGFVISVYETYQITGDRKQFEELWPNVKRAGRRILDQVELYGSEAYPYTFDESENSYDAGGDPNPFNASLSAVAYRLLVEMAREQDEPELARIYGVAYDTVVQSFRQRYLQQELPIGKHPESFFGGQWLALHLELGEIWTAAETDRVLSQLDERYHPYHFGLGYPKGTYDEWTPYILTHYGGLLLNTRRESQWRALQIDAYERQYLDRNQVFNHPLDVLPVVQKPKWIANNTHSDKQYISMPGLWRNYYDIVGYHRDLRTNELWLKPIVLEELNGQMTNAMVVSREGYGSVSCSVSGSLGQNKKIDFRPERKIEVSAIHLSDEFGTSVNVLVNGVECQIERAGTGYGRELVVVWSGTVTPDGLRISVVGDPGRPRPSLPKEPEGREIVESSQSSVISAYQRHQAEEATTSAGTQAIDIDGVRAVASCNNFDFIRFDGVDFGDDGARKLFVRLRSLSKDASIEIVLNNVGGESIAVCEAPGPSNDATFVEVSCDIRKTTGVHDVILRFSGTSSDDLMQIDSLEFR